MPSKYVVRDFLENSYYHVYNQGTEDRKIFLDEKDYRFFETYLSIYLCPLDKVIQKYPDLPVRLHKKNLAEHVDLLGYCLMPNHFHLLLRQRSIDGVSKLMKQLTNAYTLFFNQKNKKSGRLMQGRYKAARVEDENLLGLLLRYIHQDPVESDLSSDVKIYQWSSYSDYLNAEPNLIHAKQEILKRFSSVDEFESFHLEKPQHLSELEKIKID